jgi:hypothetical protein
MCQATGHLKRFLEVTVRQGEVALAELHQYVSQYDELTTVTGDEEETN